MAPAFPRELAEQFGRNLIRCRKRADLSQEELGFLASLHRTEIGMLERGIRLPRIDTLLKLAGGLEIEPGELLEGMGWMPSDPRIGSFRISEEDPEEGR
ncbi:MAG TPA: helix-turn-helix transcriptional regulator [Solirubrobacterales bacterium]